MQNVIAQVAGVALLVLGAQGGIRLVADHANVGVLGWLPGGFAAQLACYVALAALGVALAIWGKQHSDRADGGQ
ncbi:hypothetical protein [Mycobacterium sp. UM_WWY]